MGSLGSAVTLQQLRCHCEPVRHCVLGEHLPGGAEQAWVVFRVVLRRRMVAAEQWEIISLSPGVEERRPAQTLSVFQRVGQGLALALGQQHDAEHGEYSERGEHHVVQEVATVVLQLHQWRCGCAHAARSHHQTQSATPETDRADQSGVKQTLTFWRLHFTCISSAGRVSCLPHDSRHDFTGEEHTKHGQCLRGEKPHEWQHQHQASMQVWQDKVMGMINFEIIKILKIHNRFYDRHFKISIEFMYISFRFVFEFIFVLILPGIYWGRWWLICCQCTFCLIQWIITEGKIIPNLKHIFKDVYKHIIVYTGHDTGKYNEWDVSPLQGTVCTCICICRPLSCEVAMLPTQFMYYIHFTLNEKSTNM